MNKVRTYQFLFKKGSEWRGYHSEYGIVIPDGPLLIILMRSSFKNIVLIEPTMYTKQVDQEYYEVSGMPLNTSLPTTKQVEEVLFVHDSYRIRDEMMKLYSYGGFCVAYEVTDATNFYTCIDGEISIIKYRYDEDNDVVFTDFLYNLINNAEDFDISTMTLPVKATRLLEFPESEFN